MNVIAIGADIVKVSRMKPYLERQSLRNKTFTEKELRYALKHQDPLPFLAARFAVKESVLKVLKKGSIKLLNEIEVLKDEDESPFILLRGLCKEIMEEKNIKEWQVSISHERGYAIAFVIGGA
ncbi:hypothetical protein AZF37_06905 [endosymbiont 'TC1' of Trimyema compressum]|uniref:holo-ACP synthase n=1 Tax=endosymbiont 'TC1' of Trimyema compressum TaxID=243899 RepID=UPI0007F0EB25|nr:holo-ACP synthase [endosymbiont 'TC1' of Trimyema compressum]AMP20928.1 hypothetical protein AZF37_06905 [endosymbiont 'TC1' of Trimyema compressum]